MKLITFSCYIPLIIAHVVSGSAALSPDTPARSMLSKLSGGAVKAQGSPRRVRPTKPGNGRPNRTPLTQRAVAFLPWEADTTSKSIETDASQSLWAKFKGFLGPKDGLSLKERFAKKGFAAFLTFTMLSNITSMSCISFAWYAFSVQTGMSPLFPGQWKPFLGVLAGSMAVDASLKPIKLALSLAMAPITDRIMSWLQRRCNDSKRIAAGIAFAAIIGSTVALAVGGVGLSSSLSGVPLFAP